MGNLLYVITDSLKELIPLKFGRHKFALQILNLLNYIMFIY